MVAIGEKTKKIVEMYRAGNSVDDIAQHFGISAGSVKKRLLSFDKIEKGFYTPGSPNYQSGYVTPPVWSIEQVKEGFERFIAEHGRLPTAYEVDDTDYLPSARQIQRRWGGLSELRLALGYGDVHFGKGDHRGASSRKTGLRGGNAEDKLNELLVERFGELFVHSEWRFGVNRNRIDFIVYAHDTTFGIDVFATDEKRTIIKNIAVKIPKYIGFPAEVPLFFVVWSESLSQTDIDDAVKNMGKLSTLPNLKVLSVDSLLEFAATLEPLEPPTGYQSLSA
jgi:hypothetical protein